MKHVILQKQKVIALSLVSICIIIVSSFVFFITATPENTQTTQTYTAKIFMAINDGEIEGSVTEAGKEGWIRVYKFSHNIRIPTNQNGQLTGSRKHSPIIIAKEVDKSSPLLFKAVTEGLTYDEVVFRWYRLNNNEGEEHYYTIELESVKTASMTTFSLDNTPMEEVSFRYGRITWTWIDGGIEYSDTWPTR